MQTFFTLLLVLAALAFVLLPVVQRRRRTAIGMDASDLDAEIARFRTALRAGSVCARCLEASPPDATFCMRCGRRMQKPAKEK